jgi:hypothetical protein
MAITKTGVMTEPQFKYLIKLTGLAYAKDAKTRAAKLIELAGLDFNGASVRIDELKVIVSGTPKTASYTPKAAEPKVMPDYLPPCGSYMIRGIEVELKKPKYSWGTPSVIVDGKYVGYVGQGKANAAFSALKTEADALDAVIAYAAVTHKCGVCHTKLTDPKSIAAGIGPQCAKKYSYKI